MDDKELEKCKCGGDCGCGEHDENSCGCGCSEDEEESFVIDLEDENGNLVTCDVIDAFVFEEKEYLLAQNPNEDAVYLFRVDDENLVVPEEEEFNRVADYYAECAENEQ